MTTRRRYTKTEKAKLVGLASLHGTRAAADSAGVPESTVRYWLDAPEFAQLRTKTRDQVAEEMWAAIQIGVKELANGLKTDAPLRDKATAVGILWDKHALMTGGATGRTESRDITGTLSDSDVIAAIHAAESFTTAGGAPAEDPDPAEG